MEAVSAIVAAKAASRKAEALAFISADIMRTGHSPSIGDIAAGLGVGKTRAKALVHQLANENSIERPPGAQRAISVPGLFEQLVIDKLRSEGWTVDRDVVAAETCPQEHLVLVAVLDHVPDVGNGEGHDPSHEHV